MSNESNYPIMPDNFTRDSIDKQFWDYFEPGSLQNTSLVVEADAACVVGVYVVLFVVGGTGNVALLLSLARSRRRSRVNLLMTHLALADVCVTCGVIPLEIGWKFTNAWLAGNFCCKLFLVLRAFGLYLSSNVLVCISVDRFFAVLYPLRLPAARRRSKQMLYCAWAMALACSLPQSVVFSVKQHPVVPGFSQCVSFEAFSSPRQEVAYNVFCLCAMYFLPLAAITACYVRIFAEIHRSSRELGGSQCAGGPVRLRRSDRSVLRRARRRTLRMTVTIVSVFALCWLPYATMCLWYMIDRDSAQRVSNRIQSFLFAMAVSNSCMNPVVYGSYCLGFSGVRRFCKRCCMATSASDTIVPYVSTGNTHWSKTLVLRDCGILDENMCRGCLQLCIKPVVRGSYCLDFRGERRFCKRCCEGTSASDTIGNSGASSSMKRNVVESPVVIKNGRVPRVRFAETTLTVNVAVARAPA